MFTRQQQAKNICLYFEKRENHSSIDHWCKKKRERENILASTIETQYVDAMSRMNKEKEIREIDVCFARFSNEKIKENVQR